MTPETIDDIVALYLKENSISIIAKLYLITEREVADVLASVAIKENITIPEFGIVEGKRQCNICKATCELKELSQWAYGRLTFCKECRYRKDIMKKFSISKEECGLLCNSCNTALGNLGDDIAGITKALEYLKRPLASFMPTDKQASVVPKSLLI